MPTPASSQSPATEPIVTAGWVSALVTALIGVLVAFGLPLTDEQTAAVLGLTAVLAPIVVAVVGRRSVVEYASAGQVRAGAASELDTGDYVRAAGSLDVGRHRDDNGDGIADGAAGRLNSMGLVAALAAALLLTPTGSTTATAAPDTAPPASVAVADTAPPPGQDVSLSLGVIERATDPVHTTDGIDLKTYAHNSCDSDRWVQVFTGKNATGTKILLAPCTRTKVDIDSVFIAYSGFGGCFTQLNGRDQSMGVKNTTWHLDIRLRVYGKHCK